MNKWFRLLRYDWPLHFVLMLTNWLPDNLVVIKFRGWLASHFFLKAGKSLQIGRHVTFYNPSKIIMGDNVYIATGCWFSCTYGFEIESDVLFGPYVVVVTSNHSLEKGAYYWGNPVKTEKVLIQYGSWIGAHATILPGAIINRGVLLAANSVFSGSSEAYGIYGGVPAKMIGKANHEEA